MSEGFSNPVANAIGTLVRNLMKSVNYIAGVSGWRISRDGSAEFSDVTIRGEFDLGGNTPGTARIVMSQTLPAPLNTFTWSNTIFGANNYHYTEGIIIYGPGDDTTYQYLCQVSQSSSPSGSRIFHLGQVIAGAVLVDANGNPKVQEWNYQTASPNLHHWFHSDEFKAEVLDFAGNVNQVAIGVGSAGIVSRTVGGGAFVTGHTTVTIDNVAAGGGIGINPGSQGVGINGGPFSVNSGSEYRLDGTKTRVQTDNKFVRANAAISPNAVFTVVPGMTTTITSVRANALLELTVIGDVQEIGSSTTTSIGCFFVDGVQVTSPQLIFSGQTLVGLRATIGQQHEINVAAAGNHTVDFRVQNTGSSTAHQFAASHSTLKVIVTE